MGPTSIIGLENQLESLKMALAEDALVQLELFVKDTGPRIVAAIESDVRFALSRYESELEKETMKPDSPEKTEQLKYLEKAIEVMKSFPGTMHIGAVGLKIKVTYDNLQTFKSLNFGTRETPKLDIHVRTIALMIREALKCGIKLERDQFNS